MSPHDWEEGTLVVFLQAGERDNAWLPSRKIHSPFALITWPGPACISEDHLLVAPCLIPSASRSMEFVPEDDSLLL